MMCKCICGRTKWCQRSRYI